MQVDAIGEAAGRVWKALGSKDRVAVGTLTKSLKAESALVQLALGWLARENKVELKREGRNLYVSLTLPEREAFRRHSQTA